jgi:hypothetical protein
MSASSEKIVVRLGGKAATHSQRLKGIAQERKLEPLLQEVFVQMMANLETRPREWGDPYRNYRSLNAVGYGKTILEAGLRI